MRHVQQPRSAATRPLVGIAVDGASAFGRGIMRGAMQYINSQRRWEIHTALRRTFERALPWPECDGAIVAGVSIQIEGQIHRRSRHLISCSGSADPVRRTVVCLDDRAVGAMAAAHLMECRLAAFSYYGDPGAVHSRNRLDGFSAALARRGYSVVPCPVSYTAANLDTLEHRPALAAWLRELPKPIGILAVDDSAALDLATACRHADIGVPEHVAILGVNNDDLICESAWSPLSSIDAGYPRIGYTAAQLLDRLLAGRPVTAAERHLRLPPLQVVKRLSTDILAVDDPQIAEAMRYINEHACDPCSVEDVLARVPVGRRWLERHFEEKLGRSPGAEILRVQMETAKKLLLQTELALPDVAERCGFSGAPAFGRAFLRAVGDSPASFRRNRQLQHK